MKTMKNVLMILLGAALVLSLAGVGAVAAATNQNGNWGTGENGEITVSYNIGESYSVTIPSNVDLKGASNTQNLQVQATLGTSSNLVVNVTSTNGWKVVFKKNEQTYSIPYNLTIDGKKIDTKGTTEAVPIYTLTESNTVTMPMVFAADPTKENPIPTMAGAYTDTLTFTVTHTPTPTT